MKTLFTFLKPFVKYLDVQELHTHEVKWNGLALHAWGLQPSLFLILQVYGPPFVGGSWASGRALLLYGL